jgi:hypothetical protein
MGKIKIENMVGKDFHSGAGDYTISMNDLVEFGFHLTAKNDGKIPLLNLDNLEKPVDDSKISIPDLLYLERNYKKISKTKLKITDLITPNISKKNEEIVNTELLCDSPSCRRPIRGNHIAYSPEYNEIYHPGDCITYAIALKAFNSGKIIFGNIDYISRKEAIRLKGLEKKAE